MPVTSTPKRLRSLRSFRLHPVPSTVLLAGSQISKASEFLGQLSRNSLQIGRCGRRAVTEGTVSGSESGWAKPVTADSPVGIVGSDEESHSFLFGTWTFQWSGAAEDRWSLLEKRNRMVQSCITQKESEHQCFQILTGCFCIRCADLQHSHLCLGRLCSFLPQSMKCWLSGSGPIEH